MSRVPELIASRIRRYMLSAVQTAGTASAVLSPLVDSIAYTLEAESKMLRGRLCFHVADLLDVAFDIVLPVAASVEMVHTASLMLDDLPQMDDAATRRGRPANHRQFGADTCILASVALLSRANEIILSHTDLPARRRIEMGARLNRAIGVDGLVRGQYMDLKLGRDPVSEQTLESICRYKTAALFVAAAGLGSLCGTPTKLQCNFHLFAARYFGIGFQILDDIDDIASVLRPHLVECAAVWKSVRQHELRSHHGDRPSADRFDAALRSRSHRRTGGVR